MRRHELPPPRHARGRRRRSLVLPVVAGVLTSALLIPVGYAAYAYDRFDSGITRVDAITPTARPSASSDVSDDVPAQNILLVGDDHRPAGASPQLLNQLGTDEDGGGTNTDTMIVLHIAAGGRSASMISLPRDSYVPIPGHGTQKLNAAFAIGQESGGADGGAAAGARLLIASVQDLTGLTIDHYVRVSLVGFYEIVQRLGPVQVCLNHAVQDSYSGIDLPAGTSTLDASQALAFVRQRHGLPRGDLDRQVRQQYFLTVEAQRMFSAGTLLDPVKLSGVLDAVSSSIETDSGLDLLSLATELRHLRPDAIRSGTLPVAGTPTITVNGAPLSIVEIDRAAVPAFIASMTDDAPASPAPTASPSQHSEAAAPSTDAPAAAPVAPTPSATPAGTVYADVPCIN